MIIYGEDGDTTLVLTLITLGNIASCRRCRRCVLVEPIPPRVLIPLRAKNPYTSAVLLIDPKGKERLAIRELFPLRLAVRLRFGDDGAPHTCKPPWEPPGRSRGPRRDRRTR